MKIAFLSFYSGQVDRGVEIATLALAKRLQKKHTVIIFQAGKRISKDTETVVLPVENKWPTDSSNNFWRSFYLDYYSRKIFQFTWVFLQYFIKEKYDLVIPTNGGWQIVLLRIMTWIHGKKMLVQGNAGIGRDDLFQLVIFPDYYIAISPQGFKWAVKKFPWVRKAYIPYGVDISNIEKAKPVTVSLKKPIVLCVAAFLPYKQIDLLIQAMVYVPQASLLIIGQGPEETKLITIGKQLLGERFLLLNSVTHENLIGYYKCANIFSLPSKSSEAFGIVYIEALAAGLAVVAPDDPNRREIIGNAGLYVNPTNAKEYAEMIRQALTVNFGDKPINQAKKYDWDSIAIQYESLLTKM